MHPKKLGRGASLLTVSYATRNQENKNEQYAQEQKREEQQDQQQEERKKNNNTKTLISYPILLEINRTKTKP
jgi:uncharacterized protein YaiL (DUF2058 family)